MTFPAHHRAREEASARKNFSKNLFRRRKSHEEKEILLTKVIDTSLAYIAKLLKCDFRICR